MTLLPLKTVREGEEGTDDWDDEEDVPKQDAPEVVAALKQLVPATPVKVRYGDLLNTLFLWFKRLYPLPGATDFVLDAAEAGLALVPPTLIEKVPRIEPDETDDEDKDNDDEAGDWRENSPFVRWCTGSGVPHRPSGRTRTPSGCSVCAVGWTNPSPERNASGPTWRTCWLPTPPARPPSPTFTTT